MDTAHPCSTGEGPIHLAQEEGGSPEKSGNSAKVINLLRQSSGWLPECPLLKRGRAVVGESRCLFQKNMCVRI